MSDNSTYCDFSVDFIKNKFTSDLSKVIDRTAIRQSVSNILLTMKGEKPFNRNFGCDIHKYLFENMGSIALLKLQRDIGDQLGTWEPRITMTSVVVDESDMDSNNLGINVTYIINQMDQETGSSFEDSISVTIKKVR
tara:strand:+ start:170 stop:580 length:411 start_codon:yes stop_codon:yes gene_type:complete